MDSRLYRSGRRAGTSRRSSSKKDADAKHAEVKSRRERGAYTSQLARASPWTKPPRDGSTMQREPLERATCKTLIRAEHVNIHIIPLLGRVRLSEISVPVVSQFKKNLAAKKVKQPLIRKIVVSLGSIIADAQENGLAAHNAVRDLRRNKKHSDRKLEQRHKRKLKIGVDIPTKEEVSAIISTCTCALACSTCGRRLHWLACVRAARPPLGGCRP